MNANDLLALLRHLNMQNFTVEENTDFDASLVENVQKHANLYDEKHPSYRNKRKRRNSWAAIARALKIEDVDMLKTRWNELAEKFSEEYTQFPPLDNEPRENSSKLFKQLLWLAPHVTQFIKKEEVKTDNNKEKVETAINGTATIKKEPNSQVNEDTTPPQTVICTMNTVSCEKERNTQNEGEQKIENLSNQEEDNPDNSKQDKSGNDSIQTDSFSDVQANQADKYFTMEILTYLQAMPLEKKLKFKRGVFELLEDCLTK